MSGTTADTAADTEADAAPALRLRLLGAPQWARDDGAVGPLAARDAALLALLAVDGHVARDRIAAWLWPEASSQANANLSLRQRLFRLRRDCGHALVDAGLTLNLLPGVRVDLHAQPLATEGVLLAGLDFSRYEAFDDWLRAARSAIGARQADGLSGQAASLEERGALAEAIVLTERIVATWPATEHAWRRLMRLHWRRADRAAAVAAFERFEQQVCREWGLRPSAETVALLDQIERDDAGRSVRQHALPPALQRPPLLIGRAPALAVMAGAWADGRASLLLAPGGMGKSRLLEAFVAGRPGVLRVRARPGDAGQPYATLAHALDEALTRFSPPLPAGTQSELARLLPRLGPPPAAPARETRLRQAITDAWTAAMAQGLQAVVWDDLHWADAATLELLHAQLANPSLDALRQVFSARPDEGTPADTELPRWLGDSLRVQPLRLEAWQAEDLRALLPTLGLPPALSADVSLPARLLRQTGGQPFFVLETLKTLVLADASGAAPAPAPAVGAMVDRRIARLGAHPHRLLQLLAVAGEPLPGPLAAAILGRPLVDLAADWTALSDAQLVHDDGLAHDLVRDTVLAGLPLPARQALHLALAQALAVQPGIDASRRARHWQAAQAPAQAAEAWVQAAMAAVRTGRLTEALALFEKALAAADAADAPALQVAVLAAAQPTRLLHDGPEAVAATLAPRLAQVGDPAPRARLLLLQAEVEMSRMCPDAADVAAAEALALCDDDGDGDGDGGDAGQDADPLLLAEATLMRGRTLAWTGRAEAGVRLLQAACERAERDGDLRRRLQAQGTLADVLVAAGQRVQSAAVQQRTLALARRLGDRFEVAVAASNLAVYALLIGDAATAFTAGGQALDAFAAMGVTHVNRLMCAGVYAISAAHHGRFDLAEATAAPLLDGPDDPVRRNLRNTLATLALWQGRPEEAAALLPPLNDDAPLSVRVTGLMARLRWCAWTGHDDTAERAALDAIGRAQPALRDDPHYYRGWAPFDPPHEALPRLDRMAAAQEDAGAPNLARSLAAVALQIAVARGSADAADRALRWHRDDAFAADLHPALYPPEVLLALSAGLKQAGDDQGAARVRAAAIAWIDQATLPEESSSTRARFIDGNPIHRALFAGRDAR
ncbi:MAG: AAA family ATPase [Burkholderiaceae bacterium]|nr:AAA family ATPase [Burkholderiaceae bacterium]